jgi:DNA-binding transcriptional MerR regulator
LKVWLSFLEKGEKMIIHSVAETAEILGIPGSTFLYYRKTGQVFPPRRSAPKGILVYYDEQDLKKLQKIVKKLRDALGEPKERVFSAEKANEYHH